MNNATEAVCLPKTWKAILANFPGKLNTSLRRDIFNTALFTGSVTLLSRSIGFTSGGEASLEAVEAVIRQEWVERGYDKITVGDDGYGQATAYLDQPAERY